MDEVETANIKKREREYYTQKKSDLSENETSANERYKKYARKDPFIDIEAALLNSADIFRYVAKTGMIYPFYPEKLAGASYEVAIKGDVIWWDKSTGEMQKKTLEKEGDSFDLQPNSIAFVTLEPTFRIPDYMALRFNLKIAHIYKGLLLGTGPLVDPGFVGKLSIPLHNLTSNTYVFKFNDGIIQMEFTKVSKNKAWNEECEEIDALYKRKWIPPDRTVKDYLDRALQESQTVSVQSAIPKELARVERIARKSRDNVASLSAEIEKDFKEYKDGLEKSINRSQIISLASILSIAALVVSVLVFAGTTIYQYRSIDNASLNEINKLQAEYTQMQENHQIEIDRLNKRITELEKILSDSLSEEK